MTTIEVGEMDVEFHEDEVVTLDTATLVSSLPSHSHARMTPVSIVSIPAQVDNTVSVTCHVQEGVPIVAAGDDCEEPAAKRAKTDSDIGNSGCDDTSIKQLIMTINKAIGLRLDGIEAKLETVLHRVHVLEDHVDCLLGLSRQNSSSISSNTISNSSRRGAVIVGLPQPQNGTKKEPVDLDNSNGSDGLGSKVTLITLNSEEDFPTGTWLGDENNLEMRVRVPITPSDLLHVHSNCRTPEKMALTLLDYIFDRDTQAASNLSGLGKHGKKQLDPLMIYGIRCHLIQRFGVSENDWHRIKQNIDSKCRTAWRRRQRGLPMAVKAFRGKSYLNIEELSGSEEDSVSQDAELHIRQGEVDLRSAVAMAGDGAGGEIQILHATPEQISQLQHAQHIQILSGDQVFGQLQPGELNIPGGCHVATVSTESGEVLQIHNPNVEGSSE